MRDQRDLVKQSLERTYPRDVYPLRKVVDGRSGAPNYVPPYTPKDRPSRRA